LEKFPGYSGENSEIPDLAPTISNKFAKADTQYAELNGDLRPEADAQSNIYRLRPK
jgi:hypothetical protein